MTERYEEYGGGCRDRWDGIIENRCPTCGVEAGAKCVNKLTGKPSHLPCIKRLKVVSA